MFFLFSTAAAHRNVQHSLAQQHPHELLRPLSPQPFPCCCCWCSSAVLLQSRSAAAAAASLLVVLLLLLCTASVGERGGGTSLAAVWRRGRRTAAAAGVLSFRKMTSDVLSSACSIPNAFVSENFFKSSTSVRSVLRKRPYTHSCSRVQNKQISCYSPLSSSLREKAKLLCSFPSLEQKSQQRTPQQQQQHAPLRSVAHAHQ